MHTELRWALTILKEIKCLALITYSFPFNSFLIVLFQLGSIFLFWRRTELVSFSSFVLLSFNM